MKTLFNPFVIILMIAMAHVGLASATPLTLNYTISDVGPSLYQYDFELVVDNNDGSWTAGDNFNWIVVGDCFICTSPLTDWTWLTVSEPDFSFTQSTGGHNGPTLLDSSASIINEGGWYTTALGDTLSFSGTSSAHLGQGDMLWSSLIRGEDDTSAYANFEIGNLLSVPEPATLSLLSLGLIGFASLRGAKSQS